MFSKLKVVLMAIELLYISTEEGNLRNQIFLRSLTISFLAGCTQDY